MKGCKKLLACGLLVCLFLGGCAGNQDAEPTTAPATTTAPTTTAAPATSETSVPETTTQPATIVFAGEVHTIPEKSGDMIFTDDASNKFIRAVSQKYGVDASLLVCIYADPADDNNYVWQFNGQKDADGKLIRNADTLQYVYPISADCKSIARAGGLTGNDGVNAAGGFLLMQTAKRLMIPKYQDQLNA